LRLAADLPSVPTFARDARHLGREKLSCLIIVLTMLGGAQELAFQRPPVDVERHRSQQIRLAPLAATARVHLGGGQSRFVRSAN